MQSQRLIQSGEKVRVLVVDDSAVLRRALGVALESDSDIEVVGYASSGELALQKVLQLHPDVVTLDVEMPGMNGLETLSQLKRLHRGLRVIMVSSQTARGAEVTMDALSRGADDYAAKPAVNSMEETIQILAGQLCPRVKQFFRLGLGGIRQQVVPIGQQPVVQQAAIHQPPAVRPRAAQTPLEVIVIGISTGGPQALAAILPSLDSSFQLPLVIVQHMPAMFTRLMSERLNEQCALQIREAEQGISIERGTVTIAPGDFHTELRRSASGLSVRLHQEPPEHGCRPAVDVLFRSAAALCGASSAAFVMTGMGQDGLAGARVMKAAGARIFAQDEASSVVWGMPGEVVRAALADKVLGLEAIANELRSLDLQSRRQLQRL